MQTVVLVYLTTTAQCPHVIRWRRVRMTLTAWPPQLKQWATCQFYLTEFSRWKQE